MKNFSTLIAMSGGVDSSVAAYLTQQEGFSCIGGMMHLHALLDTQDAEGVASRLGMSLEIFDCREAFRREIIGHFIGCYEQGLTPNPCVLCNQKMKFGLLLEKALELGCHWIVTGHYARIRQVDGRFLLQKAADAAKDQSYFLYCLTQHQLAHSRFPLGELTKEQVRAIAQKQGFLNAKKKDSQDICFIPGGDYLEFLTEARGAPYPSGDFLDESGKVVGKHSGAVGFTRGQRKGLGLAMGSPVYVLSKDMQSNTVTVGPNEALFSTTLVATDLNWFPFDTLTEAIRVKAKARSRMVEQPATVYPIDKNTARVVFDEPQRAITTGQAVVFYNGDTVLGGGTIQQLQI